MKIGVFTLLFLILLILKLCKVITWSWWLVFAPLWAIPVMIFFIFAVAMVLAAIGK